MKITDRLEPDVVYPFYGVGQEDAVISAAISLKRIADALNEPNAWGEVGTAAIAGAILRGMRGTS